MDILLRKGMGMVALLVGTADSGNGVSNAGALVGLIIIALAIKDVI